MCSERANTWGGVGVGGSASGGQRLDTWGTMPDEGFQSPFLYCASEAWMPEPLQGSIKTINLLFWDRLMQRGNYYSQALPPVCLFPA